jgi:hypothetical protein
MSLLAFKLRLLVLDGLNLFSSEEPVSREITELATSFDRLVPLAIGDGVHLLPDGVFLLTTAFNFSEVSSVASLRLSLVNASL